VARASIAGWVNPETLAARRGSSGDDGAASYLVKLGRQAKFPSRATRRSQMSLLKPRAVATLLCTLAQGVSATTFPAGRRFAPVMRPTRSFVSAGLKPSLADENSDQMASAISAVRLGETPVGLAARQKLPSELLSAGPAPALRPAPLNVFVALADSQRSALPSILLRMARSLQKLL